MGKHTSKAKHHGKKGMKALKTNVGAKTATRARKTNIKYSDELSMENCQDLNQKASAHVNISYLELRSRRLKKTIQCTKAHHVSTKPAPSKLRLVTMGGDITRNASLLAVPQASQNVCLSNGEASCDQVRDSMEMQTHAAKRNHFVCSEDCPNEYCVDPRSAEMEASIGATDTEIDQDIVSLRKGQTIHSPRQKREPAIPYKPCHACIHVDQITRQVSDTDPDEREARDQRVSICICKTLFAAPNSRAEVEEFFAEIEQYEQKLLTARYNFDFQNDIPLKGRYEWINLTHS